jgi:hypothetical protein
MSPLHALLAVTGLIGAVALTFYGATVATRGHHTAIRYTGWLLIGLTIGVGSTFALAWAGGAF